MLNRIIAGGGDLQDFYNWLILKDKHPNTAYRIINCLKIIQRDCGQKQIDKDKFEFLLADLKSKERRHSYLNHFLHTARHYTKYCQEKGLLFDLTVLDLKEFKVQPFEKATMSDDEIETFLSLPPPADKTIIKKNGQKVSWTLRPKNYHKWTVFFNIMAYTGMRPGEVATLTVDDVDWGRSVFIAHEHKTGHQGQSRLVPIPPNIASALKEYISTLPDTYLFKGVDNVDWHYNFHRRIDRLGIKRRNLTPYSLRHSFITSLLSEDVNLFKVQKIVGHRRIDTTAIYAHMVTKDIQNAIMKHPIIRRQTDPALLMQTIKEVLESFNLQTNVKFTYMLEYTSDALKFELHKKG